MPSRKKPTLRAQSKPRTLGGTKQDWSELTTFLNHYVRAGEDALSDSVSKLSKDERPHSYSRRAL